MTEPPPTTRSTLAKLIIQQQVFAVDKSLAKRLDKLDPSRTQRPRPTHFISLPAQYPVWRDTGQTLTPDQLKANGLSAFFEPEPIPDETLPSHHQRAIDTQARILVTRERTQGNPIDLDALTFELASKSWNRRAAHTALKKALSEDDTPEPTTPDDKPLAHCPPHQSPHDEIVITKLLEIQDMILAMNGLPAAHTAPTTRARAHEDTPRKPSDVLNPDGTTREGWTDLTRESQCGEKLTGARRCKRPAGHAGAHWSNATLSPSAPTPDAPDYESVQQAVFEVIDDHIARIYKMGQSGTLFKSSLTTDLYRAKHVNKQLSKLRSDVRLAFDKHTTLVRELKRDTVDPETARRQQEHYSQRLDYGSVLTDPQPGNEKDACLYPLDDGRRCCECETCQAQLGPDKPTPSTSDLTPDEQQALNNYDSYRAAGRLRSVALTNTINDGYDISRERLLEIVMTHRPNDNKPAGRVPGNADYGPDPAADAEEAQIELERQEKAAAKVNDPATKAYVDQFTASPNEIDRIIDTARSRATIEMAATVGARLSIDQVFSVLDKVKSDLQLKASEHNPEHSWRLNPYTIQLLEQLDQMTNERNTLRDSITELNEPLDTPLNTRPRARAGVRGRPVEERDQSSNPLARPNLQIDLQRGRIVRADTGEVVTEKDLWNWTREDKTK